MTLEQIHAAITGLVATTQARAFLLGLAAAAIRKDREVLVFFDAQLCKRDGLASAEQSAAMGVNEWHAMVRRVEVLQAAILDYAGRPDVQTFADLGMNETYKVTTGGVFIFEKVGISTARRIIGNGRLSPKVERVAASTPVYRQ